MVFFSQKNKNNSFHSPHHPLNLKNEQKKISLFERKVKKKEPSALFVCPALEKEEKKTSNKVTNFERIKKKLDYFVLVCTRFYMMYSFVYLCQLFDPLDIILIFALLTFFLNRQTKHTKIFHPSPI